MPIEQHNFGKRASALEEARWVLRETSAADHHIMAPARHALEAAIFACRFAATSGEPQGEARTYALRLCTSLRSRGDYAVDLVNRAAIVALETEFRPNPSQQYASALECVRATVLHARAQRAPVYDGTNGSAVATSIFYLEKLRGEWGFEPHTYHLPVKVALALAERDQQPLRLPKDLSQIPGIKDLSESDRRRVLRHVGAI